MREIIVPNAYKTDFIVRRRLEISIEGMVRTSKTDQRPKNDEDSP